MSSPRETTNAAEKEEKEVPCWSRAIWVMVVFQKGSCFHCKQNHQNAEWNAENPKLGSSWAGFYLQNPQF